MDSQQMFEQGKRLCKTYTSTFDFAPFITSNIGSYPGDRNVMVQVVTEIFSASSVTDESQQEPEYFFFVQHTCNFSAEQLWVIDDAHHKGAYVYEYQITTHVVDDSGQMLARPLATMIQNSPEQDEKQTSLSESIGGNVGMFGDTLTGGVDVSSTKSYTLTDVTIVNTSNQETLNPSSDWTFQLARPSLTDPGIFGGSEMNLSYPAQLSHGTFQPVLMEFWKISQRASDKFRLHMDIFVRAEWAHTSMSGLNTDADFPRYDWHGWYDVEEEYPPAGL